MKEAYGQKIRMIVHNNYLEWKPGSRMSRNIESMKDAVEAHHLEAIKELEQKLAEYREHDTNLRALNLNLSQRLVEAENVIRFYGDREQWNISEPHGANHVIHESDVFCDWGGERARDFLKKHGLEKV